MNFYAQVKTIYMIFANYVLFHYLSAKIAKIVSIC